MNYEVIDKPIATNINLVCDRCRKTAHYLIGKMSTGEAVCPSCLREQEIEEMREQFDN